MRTLLLLALVAAPLFAQDGQPERPVVVIETSMGTIEAELYPKAAPKTVANFVGLAMATKEWLKDGQKVKTHYYDGLKFHRVIKGFMLQGGCPQGTGMGGPGYQFEDEINADKLGLDKLMAFNVEKKQPHAWLGLRSQRDFIQMCVVPACKKLGIDPSDRATLQAREKELWGAIGKISLKDALAAKGYKYNDQLPMSYESKRGYLAMANAGPNTNGSQFFINLEDSLHLNGKHTVFGKVIKGMDVVGRIGDVAVGQGSRPLKDVVIKSIRLKTGE